MIMAVRQSKCSNLNNLPLELMSAEEIYAHLLEAKCPCLQRLLKDKNKAHEEKHTGD
jgi:hypothetical protein